MKNIALMLVGAEDSFLSPDSTRQLYDREGLVKSLNDVIQTRGKYIVDVTTRSRKNTVSVLEGVRPQSIISYVVHEEFGDTANELILNTHDGEQLYMNGDQLDFVLPPKNFEIHIAGIDINGIMKSVIDKLLDLGYKVVLYTDAARALSNNHKYAITLNKTNSNFSYISSKSVN